MKPVEVFEWRRKGERGEMRRGNYNKGRKGGERKERKKKRSGAGFDCLRRRGR